MQFAPGKYLKSCIDNKQIANGQQVDTIRKIKKKKNKDNTVTENEKNKALQTQDMQNARSGKVDEEIETEKTIKNAKDVVRYLALKFEEEFGVKYSINWGKDAKLMKELLDTYGPEHLVKMIDIFSEDDNWADQAGRTIGY